MSDNAAPLDRDRLKTSLADVAFHLGAVVDLDRSGLYAV